MLERAPAWLRDALRWRWAPTVALTVGSLLYVLVAVTLVPSEIEFGSSGKSGVGTSGISPEGEPEAEAEAGTEPTTEAPAQPETRRQRRARRRAAADTAPTPEESRPEPIRFTPPPDMAATAQPPPQ
ncbi:MAG TPA: hypothetical protein VIM73_03640 [Polyangiaceae bacterium]